MADINSPRRRAGRPRRRPEPESNEFYETLAAPAPVRPYFDAEAAPVFTPAEQAIRIVAGILNLLLALRFVLALFTSNLSNGFVNTLFNVTGWMVAPFQGLFGGVPINGNGFIDLAALAAIVVVSVIAWVLSLIVRGSGA